jgi:prepilin-type processing-associated H-X9-DG protein
LPAIQAAREACRRTQCQNNLKQIAIAVQNYHDSHDHLPPPHALVPGLVLPTDPMRHDSVSMLGLILPYLEEADRYNEFDLTQLVTEPKNLTIAGKRIDLYICPSMALPRDVPEPTCPAEDANLAPGSYIISTRTQYAKWDLDGAFALTDWIKDESNRYVVQPYQLSLKHVTDGASKTLLVGEINYGMRNLKWDSCPGLAGSSRWGSFMWARGYPVESWGHMTTNLPSLYNNSEDYVAPNSRTTYRSDHPGGVQFAFLDGSVHWLGDDSVPTVRRALVTRAGNETDTNF